MNVGAFDEMHFIHKFRLRKHWYREHISFEVIKISVNTFGHKDFGSDFTYFFKFCFVFLYLFIASIVFGKDDFPSALRKPRALLKYAALLEALNSLKSLLFVSERIIFSSLFKRIQRA